MQELHEGRAEKKQRSTKNPIKEHKNPHKGLKGRAF